MGGPTPIAYTPFGELTVFIFFGLVAVTGSDWMLSGAVGHASVLAAIAIGSRDSFMRCPSGLGFNAVLYRTFRLELWFAALLSAGAVLSRLLA